MARMVPHAMRALWLGCKTSAALLVLFFFAARRGHLYYILAEGAIALSVTLSGGALFAS